MLARLRTTLTDVPMARMGFNSTSIEGYQVLGEIGDAISSHSFRISPNASFRI